jgi:uracil-DNA glycosylase
MGLKKMGQAQKRRAIENIRQEILALRESPLFGYRVEQGNLPVVGEGSLDADIVFIGEAPGKNEAKLGRPFVGMAGRVLDELLTSIGLKREDVYITNLVNDRPPENRDPTLKEIALYAPFQKRQIEIIQPRVIVTLGRHSLQFLFGLLGLDPQPIGKVHGKPLSGKLSHGDVVLVPLYHPAAAFYNRSLQKQMAEDMKIIKSSVEKK